MWVAQKVSAVVQLYEWSQPDRVIKVKVMKLIISNLPEAQGDCVDKAEQTLAVRDDGGRHKFLAGESHHGRKPAFGERPQPSLDHTPIIPVRHHFRLNLSRNLCAERLHERPYHRYAGFLSHPAAKPSHVRLKTPVDRLDRSQHHRDEIVGIAPMLPPEGFPHRRR